MPLLVLPVWTDAVGVDAAVTFPAMAIESLVGHLLFGLVLGVVFATVVDLRDRSGDAAVEE